MSAAATVAGVAQLAAVVGARVLDARQERRAAEEAGDRDAARAARERQRRAAAELAAIQARNAAIQAKARQTQLYTLAAAALFAVALLRGKGKRGAA